MDQKLKEGIKTLGLACASFNREKDKTVALIGVVVRGAKIIEGVLETTIRVDGEDATDRILSMIRKSTHFKQLKVIITRGITIAGFNYIDIKKLFEETSLPVIAIVDHEPNLLEIKEAIKNVSNWEKRYEVIVNTINLRKVETNPNEAPVFVQSLGWSEKELDQYLKNTTIVGRMPEPIRIARLIATAQKFQ